MTTIEINGKTFYPVMDQHSGTISVCNDIVVDQFTTDDFDFIFQQIQYEPKGVIFETLQGKTPKGSCSFCKCRILDLQDSGVIIGYDSFLLKPNPIAL